MTIKITGSLRVAAENLKEINLFVMNLADLVGEVSQVGYSICVPLYERDGDDYVSRWTIFVEQPQARAVKDRIDRIKPDRFLSYSNRSVIMQYSKGLYV